MTLYLEVIGFFMDATTEDLSGPTICSSHMNMNTYCEVWRMMVLFLGRFSNKPAICNGYERNSH
jgi:hypothetical protein